MAESKAESKAEVPAEAAPAAGGAKAVLLISNMGKHTDNIEWVNIILKNLKVEYTTLNCDEKANHAERARYWAISGKRAIYPQLFLGDVFIGDREDIQDLVDADTLKEQLAPVIRPEATDE